MIVTIQRELGAGGLSIGEALAGELGATLLDERRIIDELSARGGFSSEYLQKIDEAPPTFANSFMTDLARATALVQAMEWRSTEDSILGEILSLVLKHAAENDVVLIGHGGPKLLADAVKRSEIFAILLHARRDWRVEQVMRRFDVSKEQAAERVRRTDDLRKKYQQHFFSADIYDARSYDLVLDTERIGIAASIDIAKRALLASNATASP